MQPLECSMCGICMVKGRRIENLLQKAPESFLSGPMSSFSPTSDFLPKPRSIPNLSEQAALSHIDRLRANPVNAKLINFDSESPCFYQLTRENTIYATSNAWQSGGKFSPLETLLHMIEPTKFNQNQAWAASIFTLLSCVKTAQKPARKAAQGLIKPAART